MFCIYCNNKKLYQLSSNQVRCARCKKKFSPKRVQRQREIQQCFADGLTAKQTAYRLDLNYITVSKHYKKIRADIIIELENDFKKSEQKSYDEYIYIEKSKIKNNELFRAKDFITFEYGDGKVYNLLMPALDRYKDIEAKELRRFLESSKLQSSPIYKTTIQKFWQYFEEGIVRYKGVSDDNFFEYLKEFEWRFNREIEYYI